jgi:hypothetical protein
MSDLRTQISAAVTRHWRTCVDRGGPTSALLDELVAIAEPQPPLQPPPGSGSSVRGIHPSAMNSSGGAGGGQDNATPAPRRPARPAAGTGKAGGARSLRARNGTT